MKKEKKPAKPGKAPGALRRPIKKSAFEKKYIKYLEHPQDRQFFISCFEQKDDIYVIRGITKDEAKKLKILLKSIKANRKGAVNFIPLAFAGAITAAIVIFFTVFANPLLGRALEKGLEAVFEAKANVRGFRLSILKFHISVNSITVANRESPMTNLFEMGRIAVILRPEAVLRGKIYIEEISAAEIRFGTPRTVSGALPARSQTVKAERPPKPEAPPLIDLQNFDAMALLNQEFDKLNSPKLYDEAINTYNVTAEKWQNQVETSTERVQELRTNTAPVLSMNAANVRDAETIRNTIQDLTTAVNTVQAAANDITAIVTGLESDINTARRLETNARNSINDDLNHLRSFIDLGSGAAFAVIEPFIREMLSDTAEQYIEYGIIALDALEKIKAMADAQPKNEKPAKQPRFRGRNVTYPVRAYPAFYLGKLASDFTLDSWNWQFDLRSVSSNPDITGRPVTLEFGLTEETGNLNRSAGFNGSADFRTNPQDQQRFGAVVSGSNFPLNAGDHLSNIGINGFSGETDFSVNMAGFTSGRINAGGNVIISNAQLIDPRGTLAVAVGTAVSEADNVNLGIQLTDSNLSITTNITDLITRALARTAEIYARRAIADIELALRKKIDEYINGRFTSKDQVETLLRTARGNRTAIEQTLGALNAKKDEFEQRLRSMASDAAQQAGQQAGQAIQNQLPGNLPNLPGRR